MAEHVEKSSEALKRQQELWATYRNHPDSADAISQLVELYLPYVHRILGRMAIQLPSHLAIEDLMQAGMVGLYQAIERFSPDRGVTFESFAYRRIRGAVFDELRGLDNISRSCRQKIRRIEGALAAWLQAYGAAPTENELAAELDMEVAELCRLLDQAQPLLSLDETIIMGDQRKITRMDVVEDTHMSKPDEVAIHQDTLRHLRKAFMQLTPREQKILYLYYYEELRLSEIALIYDLSEARICQIHALATARLKALMEQLK